jgi:RimJ/RimL family protein N-acetyltransferase
MRCQTKRLLIRDFVEADRDAVRAWRADPEVMRYLDQPLGSDPDAWFDAVLRYTAERPRVAHDGAIVLRETGEVIGWIGIAVSPDLVAGELVVGYALRRSHWGKGYMTEALIAVLGYGFTKLGARTIRAQYYVANPASARVMEKAGMKPDGPAVSADPSLGESRSYVARREEWRPPGHRRLGLVLVLVLLGLIAVPTAVGPLMSYLDRPGLPDDPRLLPWRPRGDLVEDRDFLDQAEQVWRRRAERAGPGRLGDVHPLWAGTIGSGRVALLQAVGADGHGYVAQVADHDQPAVLRVDRQERLGRTPPPALVINYDGNVEIPMLRPGRGSALLRLLVPPADQDSDHRRSPTRTDRASAAPLSRETPSASRVGPDHLDELKVWRRVREIHDIGNVYDYSDWEQLRLEDAGLTETWLHLDSRSPSGSTMVLVRPAPGGPAVGGRESVTTVVAHPSHLVTQEPDTALVDPTWGPLGAVDLAVYEDAQAVSAGTAPAGAGSAGARTQAALLAASADSLGRLAVLEVRTSRQTRVGLVAWEGHQVACVATRPYPDLAKRSVVALGCTRPGSNLVAFAMVARPGVDKLTVREVTAGAIPLSVEPPVLRRVAASDAPREELVVTALRADGSPIDTDTLRVSEGAPRAR